MSNNKKKVYAHVENPVLKKLVGNIYFMLASNWVFQGFLISTWCERIFRFCLDVVMTTIISLTLFSNYSYGVIFSFIISHTINCLFNGNLISAFKFHNVKFDMDKNEKFVSWMKDVLNNKFSNKILGLIIFGSISRDEFKSSSDIDARLIRLPGFVNCVSVNIVAFYMRSNAFVRGIPLDLFICDSVVQVLDQTRSDESPVIIFDPSEKISRSIN